MALGRDTTFTWYGHSCVEVRTPGGLTILIDPWFANPRSPKAPDQVERCDLMIVTHGHFDHFGDCLSIASRTRPTWPCIHELSLWLGRNFAHKDLVIGMNKGGTVDARGIKVTFTHADHSAGDIYGTAEAPIYLGEPVGAIVELENGFRFFHAGDTALFSDLKLIVERNPADVAFIPIGGHYTMDRHDAVVAAEFVGADLVIPVHYNTFPPIETDAEAFKSDVESQTKSKVAVLAPGESHSL
jgi:L-ascorbate metabolism protein UlaG (beta-lactamase superfamily)